MSKFETGKSPVTFCGYVVRKWVSPGGRYASLCLDVPGERGGGKYDFRCFADGPLSEIGNLQGGQLVEVTCSVDMECLRNKAKQDVKIDGYSKWVPVLTVRSMEVQPASALPDNDDLKW
jgi:hypothetical protein